MALGEGLDFWLPLWLLSWGCVWGPASASPKTESLETKSTVLHFPHDSPRIPEEERLVTGGRRVWKLEPLRGQGFLLLADPSLNHLEDLIIGKLSFKQTISITGEVCLR